MAVTHRLEHGHDPALGRPIAPPPRADRVRDAEVLLHRLEHRLHLGRQAGKDVDVVHREPRRAAEGILERPRPDRQHRPARCVLRIRRKPRPQLVGDVAHLLALDLEGRGDRFAGDVVRRPAEPSGDEDEVSARRLGAHELGDAVELVRQRRDQVDRDAEGLEPLGEPRAVRVGDVA